MIKGGKDVDINSVILGRMVKKRRPHCSVRQSWHKVEQNKTILPWAVHSLNSPKRAHKCSRGFFFGSQAGWGERKDEAATDLPIKTGSYCVVRLRSEKYKIAWRVCRYIELSSSRSHCLSSDF